MMPDPNSPTSSTPRATPRNGLLHAAAVQLLAADRLAELIGAENARSHCLGLAMAYGVDVEEAKAILRLNIPEAQRAMASGQVPA